MTLAKGIYYRARKEIKISALCPQLALKILGVCVVPQPLGVVDCLGICLLKCLILVH